jgi:hypothetical protein
VLAKDYVDSVRVTRDGELRAMRTAARLTAPKLSLSAQFEVVAHVRHGKLERRVAFELLGLGRRDHTLDPIDPPRGNVLNPMHPVPRITGLRPGQEWHQPLTDTRSDIIREIGPWMPEAPKAMLARVPRETRTMDWNGETHVCLIIEYLGDEYTAQTWVRESDGMVLRQEADAHG